MTAPRPIIPGATYLVSRRCTQRQFLLRPTKTTKHLYEYCLAEAAARFDVVIIAYLVMSNHHHLVAQDRLGNLPAFLAHFHKLLAKALNAKWGRWENLFSSEQVCITRCVDVADAVDKVVYVLANPVRDHLVERSQHWPGGSSLGLLDGGVREILRPKVFFRANGVMPERVALRTELPPAWMGSREEWTRTVLSRVARAEDAARDERMRTGRRILGRRAVRHLCAFDRPDTHAPRRQLRPFIACKDRGRRMAALAELRDFRSAYRRARAALVTGLRDVTFPVGTYWMRLIGACCAPLRGSPLLIA